MKPILSLALILTLLTGGTVGVLAQESGRSTATLRDTNETITITYGDSEYVVDPGSGTVAVGVVIERSATEDGATVTVVLFVHDATGWRTAGMLTGEAVGALESAQPGDTVTLGVAE